MRDIRFRAWDIVEKEMTPWEDVKGNLWLYLSGNYTDKHKLLQYTGLKDSTKWEQLTDDEQKQWLATGKTGGEWNGKEIYEGDIIEHGDYIPDAHTCQTHNTVVEYFPEECSYNLCSPAEWLDYIKVIGNIYEYKE